MLVGAAHLEFILGRPCDTGSVAPQPRRKQLRCDHSVIEVRVDQPDLADRVLPQRLPHGLRRFSQHAARRAREIDALLLGQIDQFARPNRIHGQRLFRVDVLAGLDAAPRHLVVAARIRQVQDQLHRPIRQQFLEIRIAAARPVTAEQVEIGRVVVVSANEAEVWIIGKGLAVELGNIPAADDRQVHAASRARLDRAAATQCFCTLRTAATMSCTSRAEPRNTPCGMKTVSSTAWSATGVGSRRT